jgi:hypothetical protein
VPTRDIVVVAPVEHIAVQQVMHGIDRHD